MPQAALAAAVWVGSSVAFAATAAGASMAFAAAAGYATIGATLAAEVYAVSKATQALTPKIKGPETTLQWQANPRAGIPYGIGRCALSGSIVFNQAAGDTNKFLNFATVYSGAGPIDGFEAFQAAGVTVPFTADGGEGASGYYLNRMWLKTQLGQANEPYLHWTATGSKDTPANHGGMPAEWTAAHKLSGYAASLWALEYDTKRYASGVPVPRMIGRWVKTYDPRQDSTYPGGAGDHRWNDETTWTWSRCPYRHAVTWIIGRRSGGVLTHGLGADIGEIDLPAFVHGANVSDANEWYVDGAVDSLDDDYEVLKGILQAGAGLPILGGSKISCMVNAPAVSLATITEADIVGAMTIPGQVSAAERINTVWPSYTEEALDWQVVTPDAPVQVAEYVALDGEERSIELGMPLIGSATQVGQISRYAIEDARELTGIVLTLFPRWKWLPPGACITVNSPEAGLVGQKVRLQKRTRDQATKLPTYICRTETDGKHAYALGQTNTPPDTPALSGVDANVVPLPGAGSWEIVGGVTANESGSLPAIVIQGESDLYAAVSIVVDYREVIGGGTSYGPWQSQTFPASATRLIVTGVKPGAVYQVRVRYITAGGTENPDINLDLGTVNTGQVIAFKVGQFTAGQIAAYNALTDQALADARDAQLRIQAAIALAERRDIDLVKDLSPPSGRPVGATIDDQVRIVETANETIAEHYIEMTAGFGASAAALAIEALTRSTADTALADYQIALAAVVGSNYSSLTSSLTTLTTSQAATALALTNLTTSFNANVASVSASLGTLTTNQSATAAALTTLTTNFNANVASVSSQLTSITSINSAQSSDISTLSATSGSHTASIVSTAVALANLNGQVYSAYGVKLNTGGHVIGFQGINNGVSGGWIFSGDYFGIATAGATKYPFFVSGSTVYLTDTVINGNLLVTGTVDAPQLASRAATSTARSNASSAIGGSGGFQTIVSHYVELAKAGTVDADCVVAQHFPSGNHNWEFQLYIDGELQFRCYGADGQDSVSLSGSKECDAGYHLVEVIWSSHSSVNVDYRMLKSMGSW